MRRTARVLRAASCLALLGALAACGDDAGGDDADGPTTSDPISSEGACEVLGAARASAVMGVEFDRAVDAPGSCTYTSTSSETALTLHVTEPEATDPALVLETLAGSCDDGTREDRAFDGADGGFSCLAGGVPTVVATGPSMVLVLTGNSRDDGVTPETVAADLVTLAGDAVTNWPKLDT